MAQQKMDDTSLSDSSKKKILLQSLLRPALDTVRSLGDETAVQCFEYLNNIYGEVVDGQELYVKFLCTNQEEGEMPSDYIQRLYLLAMDTIEQKGMDIQDLSHQLLSQFIRGCPDENLIQKLKLEEGQGSPPSFPQLLLMVRKEESRRTEKRLRLRKETSGALSATVHQLQQQMAEMKQQHMQHQPQKQQQYGKQQHIQQQPRQQQPLQQQQQFRQQPQQQSNQGPMGQSTGSQPGQLQWRRNGPRQAQRRRFFCYHCGLDGHMKNSCVNPRDANKVQQRLLDIPDPQSN